MNKISGDLNLMECFVDGNGKSQAAAVRVQQRLLDFPMVELEFPFSEFLKAVVGVDCGRRLRARTKAP